MSLSPHVCEYMQLQTYVLKPASADASARCEMARGKSKKCQVCWQHSSANRRLCINCDALVAPGCWPEQCLFLDYWPDGTGLCRPCARLQLQVAIRPLAAILPDALDFVLRSGF